MDLPLEVEATADLLAVQEAVLMAPLKVEPEVIPVPVLHLSQVAQVNNK